MSQDNYLTPRKFLQCCGVDKDNCTVMLLGSYLSEPFLKLPIYESNGNFDSYFISQTEQWTSRFFMDPPPRRHSLSRQKTQDLYDGIDDGVIASLVEKIEDRTQNANNRHPCYFEIMENAKNAGWRVDEEAMADLRTARSRPDAVRIMILLLAALFQDYYGKMGICLKVRSYMKSTKYVYTEPKQAVSMVRESNDRKIIPFSDLRTERTYVHRIDLLDQIGKKLLHLEKQGEKRFLFLYGAPGEGKSELARAYARDHANGYYKKEIWLTCPDRKMPLSLEELCGSGNPGYSRSNLPADLAEAGGDILLVVDNLNTESIALINELYYHTGDATVLITSRLSRFSGFDVRNALRVRSEEQEEFCVEVFRKNYEKRGLSGKAPELTEAELLEAAIICRSVDLNPLFVAMMAGFLREHHKRIRVGSFCRNLENGLLEAFPRYSCLDFRKDEGEPVRLPPVEVLRVIFREELNCIRVFSEAERQVINLMVLFPAEHCSIYLFSEILGDNENQWRMETALDRLISISLLQTEGEEVSIHPLICELLLSGVRMENGVNILYSKEERDAFFTHILENLFLMDRDRILAERSVALRIFENIGNPSRELELLYHCFYDRIGCRDFLEKQYPELTNVTLFAYWETDSGRTFLMHSLSERETEPLLELARRDGPDRYFNQEATEERRIFSSGSPDTEAELLFLYEGNTQTKEPCCLDFSFGIDGHPIRKIPRLLMRQSRKLFTVRFPDTLEEIDDWAFDNCPGLVGQLTLPASLQRIGKGAFHRCEHIQGELKLPSGLKVVDNLAFCFCSGLTGSLVLPEKLEYLGEMAFSVCKGLTGTVACPPSLKTVGERVFDNSGLRFAPKDLKKLTALKKRPEQIASAENVYIAPMEEGIECEKYYGCLDLTGELKLPGTVKAIGALAFYHCSRITGKLKFSSALRTIGEGAFFGCSGLTGGIELPDSLEHLGEGAFFGCSGLDGALRLPQYIREIPSGAFFMCTGLTGDVNLEEIRQLKRIHEGAFFGCTGLTGKLYLPPELERIGDGAFDNCQGLTGMYFARSGELKYLGHGCFNHCRGLKGILQIPMGVEFIGSGCFRGTGYTTCIVHNSSCYLEELFVDRRVTIVGHKGSTAEKYAEQFGNPFRVLE